MAATDKTEFEWLVTVLKALADPVRLQIYKALGRTGVCSCTSLGEDDEGMCCCDVEEVTGLSQPTVSHHLAILKRAGLVKAEKIGRWMYFRRDLDAICHLTSEMKSVLIESSCRPTQSTTTVRTGEHP